MESRGICIFFHRHFNITGYMPPMIEELRVNTKSHRSIMLANNPEKTLVHVLMQGWANYGPQAKYGPLRGSMRPAEGLENAKKKRFRKTFVRT
jgi:hypothetical protein